ncbi:RNA polymerase III transcription factor IIIC subunit-domain-containing protein [Naematelia encephala]|uniref:RNA polymerase III transcription factor IIIC subunit-domain-containing protein n=1 Tax=Naematelia encephala TaxID=71784 RepID=A0A1Y2AX78_9TREE|nr:RNA polymerase III transcription factor IIIC subunit-domain-containing protein [Naematelia encephala]
MPEPLFLPSSPSPSSLSPPPPEASSSTSNAPWKHLPKHTFGSIEYPGPVSEASNILTVISQDDINECFNAPSEHQPILEMSYRREDKAGVPVKGQRVPSQKLLLRIVRRRRKDKGKEQEGVFTASIQGALTQTVRFRSLADFHYTPNPEGRIQGLLAMLRDLDYESILDYTVPELDEIYEEVIPPSPGHEDEPPQIRSALDLQPPPIFFDKRLPQIFSWKDHPAIYEEDFQDPRTGEIRRRLANRSRIAGHSIVKIGHSHSAGEVPTEPNASVQAKLDKLEKTDKSDQLNKTLLDRLHQLFLERPVWLRPALLAQFNDQDRKAIKAERVYLPTQCYTIGAGPFWKCLVRFGYDPVHEPEAHRYQRTYFYPAVASRTTVLNPLRDPTPEPDGGDEDKRTTRWWEAEQQRLIAEGKRPPLDPSRGHIFDGQVIHRDRPDYQLCDITDPLIRQYLDDPTNVKDDCDPRDGWYKPAVMQLIKNLLRIKYMHIRSTGTPAPDSLCYDAIEEYHRVIRDEEGGYQNDSGGIRPEGEDVDMAD